MSDIFNQYSLPVVAAEWGSIIFVHGLSGIEHLQSTEYRCQTSIEGVGSIRVRYEKIQEFLHSRPKEREQPDDQTVIGSQTRTFHLFLLYMDCTLNETPDSVLQPNPPFSNPVASAFRLAEDSKGHQTIPQYRTVPRLFPVGQSHSTKSGKHIERDDVGQRVFEPIAETQALLSKPSTFNPSLLHIKCLLNEA